MKKLVKITKTTKKRIKNVAELKLRVVMRKKKKNSWPSSMKRKLMIYPG